MVGMVCIHAFKKNQKELLAISASSVYENSHYISGHPLRQAAGAVVLLHSEMYLSYSSNQSRAYVSRGCNEQGKQVQRRTDPICGRDH